MQEKKINKSVINMRAFEDNIIMRGRDIYARPVSMRPSVADRQNIFGDNHDWLNGQTKTIYLCVSIFAPDTGSVRHSGIFDGKSSHVCTFAFCMQTIRYMTMGTRMVNEHFSCAHSNLLGGACVGFACVFDL